MIAVEHLSIQFGGRYLFDDATFTIRPGDRVGLVGPNGAGKSTLMKIIAGLVTAEDGQVQIPRDYTIGYLPQEPSFDAEAMARPILEEAMRAREDVVNTQQEITRLEHELEVTSSNHDTPAYADLLDRFGELHHKLEDLGGFRLEADSSRVLSGLGFTEDDFKRPLGVFSGGWQMRVMLAKLLIRRPDALLLDEPTNHLDLESILWLEDFLSNYEGSLLLISHDRTFLNDVTKHTVEIEAGHLEMFVGNYDTYERTKAEREALREAQAATLMARRKEIESFVERFRYKATKARQAQSRIKMLERMERVELASHAPSVHFSFPEAPQSGRTVFEVENGGKSYPNKPVFHGAELRIERGDRIAFLGKNGEGKTTLGKILAGEEQFTEGELKIGHNVTIGYYAQHQADSLNPKLTVYETVETLARSMFFNSGGGKAASYSETQLRTLLGAFLFQGNDVHKPVRVLSGGEKSRLALAKMLLEPCNTLILDEPTNHLDMRSKEVLKQALMAFEGTIIMISHDRDFLDELVDRIFTFGGGAVKEYYKPLEIYLEELHESELARIRGKQTFKAEKKAAPEVAQPPVSTIDKKERKKVEADARNERAKKEKPLRNAIQKTEKEIASLEKRKEEIEHGMYDAGYYNDNERVKRDQIELAKIVRDLEACYFEWQKKSDELETLK